MANHTHESSHGSSPTLVTLTADQFTELLKSAGSGGVQTRTMDEEKELIRLQAEANATAAKVAEEAENLRAPGVGVYSRPGGERVNPKGDLRCPMTWGGFPLDIKTITAEELDLLNDLTPGLYRCMKSDGSAIKVEILGTRNFNGHLSKLDVVFATRGEGKNNLFSLADMCRDIIQQHKTAPATT